MHKLFVDSKLISSSDFELCWPVSDLFTPALAATEPFIQRLADKAILPVAKSLRVLTDKTRLGFVPIDHYDVDLDLARGFPAEACRRWCILPFDRMSKSVFVATANPFNQQAAKDLAACSPHRLLWYIAPPSELVKLLNKVFR